MCVCLGECVCVYGYVHVCMCRFVVVFQHYRPSYTKYYKQAGGPDEREGGRSVWRGGGRWAVEWAGGQAGGLVGRRADERTG